MQNAKLGNQTLAIVKYPPNKPELIIGLAMLASSGILFPTSRYYLYKEDHPPTL